MSAGAITAQERGMVFVSEPAGVSHALAESVSLQDAAVAATVGLRALESL